MKLISLRCKNCGAELQADPGRKEIYCSYCGTKLIVDNDFQITSRIVDEARLKEAEVRLKELEYEHERELRQEKLQTEQKKVFRIVVLIYVGALIASTTVHSLESLFPPVLLFGAIALIALRTGDRRVLKGNPEVDYSEKSRGVALIFAILLGMFGGHYFYVGRNGMGFLYLFTFGFLGVGLMIDIVRILCGVFRDKDGLYLKDW